MFVDDEARILAGMERALMMQEHDWECRFAGNAEEALRALEARQADVVVSDMRMPFMDGAELLAEVRQRWPSTMRVILSGHCDLDATMRMLDVAHQFVAKPCDNAILLARLASVLELRSLFHDQTLVANVGRLARLPAAPRVFAELRRLLADRGASTQQMSALLASDPALVAKIMQLANSAYFAAGGTIHDIGAAIARLGLDNIRLLVLASQVFANGEGDSCVDVLQRSALLAARLAGQIAGSSSPAATAALLANIGLIIPGVREEPLDDGTTACGTALHVAAGTYLLALWGLPTDTIDAVANHHEPARSGAGFGVAGVVHVAVALANGRTPDAHYLQGAGVAAQLPQWQQMLTDLRRNLDD